MVVEIFLLVWLWLLLLIQIPLWQTVRILHIEPGFKGESTVLKPLVNGGDRAHTLGALPLTLLHYIELLPLVYVDLLLLHYIESLSGCLHYTHYTHY